MPLLSSSHYTLHKCLLGSGSTRPFPQTIVGTPGVSDGDAPHPSDNNNCVPVSPEAFLHIISVAWTA